MDVPKDHPELHLRATSANLCVFAPPPDLHCRACGVKFETRNQLFRHIGETGHAMESKVAARRAYRASGLNLLGAQTRPFPLGVRPIGLQT